MRLQTKTGLACNQLRRNLLIQIRGRRSRTQKADLPRKKGADERSHSLEWGWHAVYKHLDLNQKMYEPHSRTCRV